MRGKRRAPRPRIPWRSPWTPLACLAGLLATGAIAVLGGMAKDVVLIVDGRRQEVRSFADSVHELLADHDVPFGDGDLVRPGARAPLADGVRVEVRHARPITLTVDGRTSRRLVTATTVRDALAELDMAALRGRLSAPRYEPVPLSGMALIIYTRRTVHIVANGTRRDVTTTGRTVRQVLKRAGISYEPGSLIRPPLRAFPGEGSVITVLPPRTEPVGDEVMRLDWDALAMCESGGDPTAYNPSGPYYGLYQFSLPMWQLVGGTGMPHAWPPEEQTYRAQLLYQRVAGRWQEQWPNCGAHLFG
ncbi:MULTISPECIES: resuscitation-promoting factor [Nonomuraea]|uniref:Ubiquitin-like domain-containing protein n=1 Tax=Nonomuraea ferruginea TaxID=46174 RepID=A0ABT4T443_9ACTN|nr:resuscitation-promoting factor [Nonomuraea ferruginea]MDA0644100.1 ubiquitin-like domain-containing protein [Nonomuraea ferruginea]